MADPSEVEARLEAGLRGQWYPVAASREVARGGRLGVVVAGDPVVLWRTEGGTLHAIEDFCPHRGARLSRGEVNGEHISCRYHGVTLDGTGTIVRVPAMPECPLEGRRPLRSYPVREAADAVFLYVPSAERPEPTPFAMPEEFGDPEWSGFLCKADWACSYRYALDNLVDPMHGCYLHADSFTLAFGVKQDLMKITKNEDGFLVARVAQQGENFDWTQLVMRPGLTFCRLDIPYPPAAGPGGPFRIVGFVTPTADNRCTVYFWRMRKVSGFARDSWRFLYRAKLEARHWHVLEQDREMLEAMPRDARRREMLYQHDVGVSRVRQALARLAKDQLAAEAAEGVRAAG